MASQQLGYGAMAMFNTEILVKFVACKPRHQLVFPHNSVLLLSYLSPCMLDLPAVEVASSLSGSGHREGGRHARSKGTPG